MNRVQISIIRESEQLFVDEFSLPLELGRQQQEDSALYCLQDLGTTFRVAIIAPDILAVPRHVVRIENGVDGGMLVRNIHRAFAFDVHMPSEAMHCQKLSPGQCVAVEPSCRLILPAGFELKIVPVAPTVERPADGIGYNHSDGSANMRTMTGSLSDLQLEQSNANLTRFLKNESADDRGKIVVTLVNQALVVVQKAAGSDEFLDAAVQSTARMISLDNTYVILREGSQWTIVSSYCREHNSSWRREDESDDDAVAMPPGSRQMLARLLASGETLICEPSNAIHSIGSSLLSLDRAVVSPLFDADRNIIGALYGDRKFVDDTIDQPIGDLEAALLEVMAGAVSAGILRLREEKARMREQSLRASMNQFFSEKVLERLQQNENLLQGRDATVTVLFCDIRGFSAISERAGPQRTIEWINDVLTRLSQCVLDTDGVLVDYIGDELMAMWGAPDDQPDHALRACQAAHAMVSQLDAIRERWRDITPDHFGIGIGINTGDAQVGNTGSQQKFKYGPLGSAVNIASRIQGMTKQFGVVTLISDSTVEHLSQSEPIANHHLHQRLIAEVQPVGMQTNLKIHEMVGDPDPRWLDVSTRYEKAWAFFCDHQFTRCASELVALIEVCPEDQPSLLLLQRAVEALKKDGQHDPVVRLKQK